MGTSRLQVDEQVATARTGRAARRTKPLPKFADDHDDCHNPPTRLRSDCQSSCLRIHPPLIADLSSVVDVVHRPAAVSAGVHEERLEASRHAIYLIYSTQRHQLPQRSFFLFGAKPMVPLGRTSSPVAEYNQSICLAAVRRQCSHGLEWGVVGSYSCDVRRCFLRRVDLRVGPQIDAAPAAVGLRSAYHPAGH